MKVELAVDASAKEPRVVLITPSVTEQTKQLLERLKAVGSQTINGYTGDCVEVLDCDRIFRIYTQNQKVYAETDKGQYLLRRRLYELEESLDGSVFVRISNSEIINAKRIKRFHVKLSGTIGVELGNGTQTYASRRYVKRIKRVFGV